MPHVELPQAEFKVVMLGDTFTGKTSLVLRFAEGYFREEGRSATVGAFFITKRLHVNGITCKIQIWDTAGQKQFRPMAPMYYKNAAAAIVCYDVSSLESYQTMRYWLDELHRNIPAGSIVIAIAATKTDLVGKENNSVEHIVDSKEAEEMANEMGAIFVDTSSLENTNVTTLFQRVAERVLQFRERAKRDGADVGSNGVIPVTPGAIIDETGQVVKKGVTSDHRSDNRKARGSSSPVPFLNSHGLVVPDADTSKRKKSKEERRRNRSGNKKNTDVDMEIKLAESMEMVEPHERSCGEMACGALPSRSDNNGSSSCVIS